MVEAKPLMGLQGSWMRTPNAILMSTEIQGNMVFLNLGYPTLAATAVRIDEHGFLRDRHENVLVGDAPAEQLNRIRELTGSTAIYRLQYREPQTTRLRRGLVRWDFQRPLLSGGECAPPNNYGTISQLRRLRTAAAGPCSQRNGRDHGDQPDAPARLSKKIVC